MKFILPTRSMWTQFGSFLIVAYGYGYPDLRSRALFEAARCYEQLGRQREAISLYQQLVDKLSWQQRPKDRHRPGRNFKP